MTDAQSGLEGGVRVVLGGDDLHFSTPLAYFPLCLFLQKCCITIAECTRSLPSPPSPSLITAAARNQINHLGLRPPHRAH